MSDTVKLIIEIPKVYYEALSKTEEIISSQRSGKTFMSVIYSAVGNGTSLDDVKAKIETDLSWDMFDEWGNETRLHKELMEILDNIGNTDVRGKKDDKS